MNERLKELLEQAHAQPENLPQYVTLDWKKFAELIVKDFQKLIKDAYLNTSPEHRDCLLMLDARVEEHFGVEDEVK